MPVSCCKTFEWSASRIYLQIPMTALMNDWRGSYFGVCLICWIVCQFLCALIAILIALQWKHWHLLGTKQPKFTESSTPLDQYKSKRRVREGNVFTGVCLFTAGSHVTMMVIWDSHPYCTATRPQCQTWNPPTTDTWWPTLVQTCSNLFTSDGGHWSTWFARGQLHHVGMLPCLCYAIGNLADHHKQLIHCRSCRSQEV